MFDWPWTAIAAECTTVLGPDGYGAVQISPPEEAVVLPGSGYPWWQAYQPVSYALTSRFGTQAQLAAMISSCHAAGVRVYDIAAIDALLTRPVFSYQDVEYGAGQAVTPDMYEGTGSLLEYRYGWDLYDAFTSGSLASLSTFGPSWNSAGMVPSADAVAFVADQDTERDGGALYYASGAPYLLANVFMLAWDYGTPMVLSDYAFSSYDAGPPGAGGNAIAPPGCGAGTWECEERWPAIAGMVGWHNAAGTAPVANWWTDASGELVYLAGNLSVLGLGQPDWAPGIPMTRVDATHWTATIAATADATLAYKYDLGGTWAGVEEMAGCGYVPNRSMTVNGGTITDTVSAWAGLGGC